MQSTFWFTYYIVVVLASAVDSQNIVNYKAETENRIFNGDNARIEDFPYLVNVKQTIIDDTSAYQCGGAILNPRIILTAAHCVHKSNPSEFEIRAGSAYSDQGGITITVDKIISHELFRFEYLPNGDLSVVDYDVALLILSNELKYSNAIQPIKLANINDNLAVGDFAVVAGWGYTYGHMHPNVLQKTKLPIISKEKCARFDTRFELTSRTFCAGYFQSYYGTTCSGDSGGPLVTNGKIYGIVSTGVTNCMGIPSVSYFANVTVLRAWIDNKIDLLYYL